MTRRIVLIALLSLLCFFCKAQEQSIELRLFDFLSESIESSNYSSIPMNVKNDLWFSNSIALMYKWENQDKRYNIVGLQLGLTSSNIQNEIQHSGIQDLHVEYNHTNYNSNSWGINYGWGKKLLVFEDRFVLSAEFLTGVSRNHTTRSESKMEEYIMNELENKRHTKNTFAPVYVFSCSPAIIGAYNFGRWYLLLYLRGKLNFNFNKQSATYRIESYNRTNGFIEYTEIIDYNTWQIGFDNNVNLGIAYEL